MTALAHRVVRQHGFLIAPIGPELHIAPVITRSILPAAMGGALLFVATLATNGLCLVTRREHAPQRLTQGSIIDYY